MTAQLEATHYDDAGCPWGYSAMPAITALHWRYGDQIAWRLVTIGLTESGRVYEERGYSALRAAKGWIGFRRFGMPLAPAPKQRMAGTARACRAVVTARLRDPGSEWRVLRALRLAMFTSDFQLDDDEQIRQVLHGLAGVDADAIVDALDTAEVTAAYEADKAETRTAAGGPTEAQGKAANSDGKVRYTAPSVIFRAGERTLEGGGFQPLAAYDVLVANLDPTLERRGAPDSPLELLRAFPDGLVTQEVALAMTSGNDDVDRDAAEAALLDLVAEGSVTRTSLGDSALWTTTG